MRFAGFFILNAMQSVLMTNLVVLTPIQSAQDLNLTREVYFQRARQNYKDPRMYPYIKEIYEMHFKN